MKIEKTISLGIVLLLIVSALGLSFPYIVGKERGEEARSEYFNELNDGWDGNGTINDPVYDLRRS